jgi:hypothetical protein
VSRCVYAPLLSDALLPNGRAGTGTRPGIWWRNKPKDPSVCVRAERGHGEGGGVNATLLKIWRE